MQRSANSVMLLADVRLVGRRVLVVDHPALRLAEVVAEVLQQALAGLVADGAVERMVEQQVFEGLLLGVLGLRAVGDDDGAVLGGRLAGGHDLGLHGDGAVGLAFADLDQAHPAAGHHGQGRVPAVVRNEHAALQGRLDQVQLLVADIDRLVVDVDDCHDASRFRLRLPWALSAAWKSCVCSSA